MKRWMLMALTLACGAAFWAMAQPTTAQSTAQPSLEQLSMIRQLVARLENPNAAKAAGYAPFGDCMSHPQLGAQGQHYSNQALIDDPRIDPMRPELVMYEPRADGSLRPIGVEYIVFKKAWQAAGNKEIPALFGQQFSLNETLLPEPFYALHLWVWQFNPSGLFAGWNPLVLCPRMGAHVGH